MKNLKLGLFSLLAILAISVFLTSCEQTEVLAENTPIEEIEDFETDIESRAGKTVDVYVPIGIGNKVTYTWIESEPDDFINDPNDGGCTTNHRLYWRVEWGKRTAHGAYLKSIKIYNGTNKKHTIGGILHGFRGLTTLNPWQWKACTPYFSGSGKYISYASGKTISTETAVVHEKYKPSTNCSSTQTIEFHFR